MTRAHPATPVGIDEPRARQLLAWGATGVAVGIAAAVLDSELLGALITVGALVALVLGTHAFGRSGAGVTPRRRRRRAAS